MAEKIALFQASQSRLSTIQKPQNSRILPRVTIASFRIRLAHTRRAEHRHDLHQWRHPIFCRSDDDGHQILQSVLTMAQCEAALSRIKEVLDDDDISSTRCAVMLTGGAGRHGLGTDRLVWRPSPVLVVIPARIYPRLMKPGKSSPKREGVRFSVSNLQRSACELAAASACKGRPLCMLWPANGYWLVPHVRATSRKGSPIGSESGMTWGSALSRPLPTSPERR
ncbi:hypothetical protein [Mesorhizobium sp. NZP2298]|uniref:hypothetical protein n=1 Tax=Mesorhizobium sp. NZP2298 TaxID=2483403 RepID=UPI001557E8C8|nr:hypothetical protein [Mesorhizobium sp. NZP2298]